MSEISSQGQAAKASNGLAIAALICGIAGFCVFPAAIAALICGIIFLVKAKSGQPKGMAIAGTVMGGLGVTLIPIALLLGILVPVLGVARKNANMMKDSVNLRAVYAAESTYAVEHGNGPISLGLLVKEGTVAPGQLVSVFDDRPEAAGPVTADNADQASSFILVPGFENKQRHEVVAAFIDPAIPVYAESHATTTVAYEDGTVEQKIPVADLEAAIQKQTGMSIEQLVRKQRGK